MRPVSVEGEPVDPGATQGKVAAQKRRAGLLSVRHEADQDKSGPLNRIVEGSCCPPACCADSKSDARDH